jgi:hypothetical protein
MRLRATGPEGVKKFSARASRENSKAVLLLQSFQRERGEGFREPVRAWVAQLVERVLGKDEVTGSIPVPGSML